MTAWPGAPGRSGVVRDEHGGAGDTGPGQGTGLTRRALLVGLGALGAAGCAAADGRVEAPVVRPSVMRVDASVVPTRICLGSCNKHDRPQAHWDVIAGLDPQLWIWLGDNVYGDTTRADELRDKYTAVMTSGPYRRLLARVPVVGTWDDHDYGSNDAGKEFLAKVETQRELLDFLGEPADSPRRRQAGVYTSYDLGSGLDSVRVILLDGRYHREPPGPSADPLGDAQWAWLEAQLRSSTAAVNLIGNGYQIIPEDHPFEGWARFEGARRRLFELVRDSGARGVVFSSGDRHHAELSRWDDEAWPYPLYELTTSGLTHAWRTADEPNRHRVGSLYREQNFGRIDFDWEARTLTLAVHDIGGEEVWAHRVPLSDIGEARYSPAGPFDDE